MCVSVFAYGTKDRLPACLPACLSVCLSCRPMVRATDRASAPKPEGCPKSKDCWGVDAGDAECIACIDSQQQEYSQAS